MHVSKEAPKAGKAQIAISTGEAGFFSGLFAALTNNTAAEFIQKGVGQYIFFPFTFGIGLVKFGLSIYQYTKAKNKNLTKSASLGLEALSTLLIAISVIGGFAAGAIFGALAPILFPIALGIKVLWDVGLTLFHGIKWASTTDPETRALHKKLFRQHLIQSLIGIGLTVSLTLAMGFGLKAALFAGSALAGFGFLSGVGKGLYAHLSSKKQLSTENEPTVDNPSAIESDNAPNEREKSSYFYSENRKAKMTQQADKKQFLINEITKKISQLEPYIAKQGFFNRFQRTKRRSKIEALNEIQKLLENETSTALKEFETIIEKNPKAFQSFFKDTGDVEDIVSAVEHYFNTRSTLEVPDNASSEPEHAADEGEPKKLTGPS